MIVEIGRQLILIQNCMNFLDLLTPNAHHALLPNVVLSSGIRTSTGAMFFMLASQVEQKSLSSDLSVLRHKIQPLECTTTTRLSWTVAPVNITYDSWSIRRYYPTCSYTPPCTITKSRHPGVGHHTSIIGVDKDRQRDLCAEGGWANLPISMRVWCGLGQYK